VYYYTDNWSKYPEERNSTPACNEDYVHVFTFEPLYAIAWTCLLTPSFLQFLSFIPVRHLSNSNSVLFAVKCPLVFVSRSGVFIPLRHNIYFLSFLFTVYSLSFLRTKYFSFSLQPQSCFLDWFSHLHSFYIKVYLDFVVHSKIRSLITINLIWA
jgi:hypothetical protein